VIHVTPVNDIHEHIVDDEGWCPCLPRLWVSDGEDRMVHNSYDGREVGDVMLAALDALSVQVQGEWAPSLRTKYEHALHLIRFHWPKAETCG